MRSFEFRFRAAFECLNYFGRHVYVHLCTEGLARAPGLSPWKSKLSVHVIRNLLCKESLPRFPERAL